MFKLLLLACCFVSTATFAQKKSWYVGGNVGFSSNQVKNQSTVTQKYSNWSFSPEVGTFLTNKIQLGLGVSVSGSKKESTNNFRSEAISYGGTLYSRYFFGEYAFKPFVGLNISALPGTFRDENLNQNPNIVFSGTTFSFGTNLNVGFAYALSPRITAVGSFGLIGYYMTQRESGGFKTVSSGFDANFNTLGNRFTIGVYYTFKQPKA